MKLSLYCSVISDSVISKLYLSINKSPFKIINLYKITKNSIRLLLANKFIKLKYI